MRSFCIAALAAAVVVLIGCESMDWGGRNRDNGNEQSVTMDQLPDAAKATLIKESGNGKILEIDKQTLRGRTVYDADVMLEGKKWEITVREDGQLLKKQLDEETDDEDEKDDD